MAIWEFNDISVKDIYDAIECIEKLEDIFGEPVVDEDFESELRATCIRRQYEDESDIEFDDED